MMKAVRSASVGNQDYVLWYDGVVAVSRGDA